MVQHHTKGAWLEYSGIKEASFIKSSPSENHHFHLLKTRNPLASLAEQGHPQSPTPTAHAYPSCAGYRPWKF
jgi:hypothetical protein